MKYARQIILLLLAMPAAALAEVDVSEWLCESCPFADGYHSDFEAGATYVSDEDVRYGNATGYDSDGVYANVDGEGVYTSDGYRQTWRIEDLGLDSRIVSIDGARQGSYGYWFEYSEIPSRVFGTTETIFSDSSGVLQLPSSWVAAGTTTGFTALND
jgi:hypothetical protein